MGNDIPILLASVRTMLRDVVRMLPTLALALVVFVIFYVVAKMVRNGVRRVNQRRRQHHNVGLVLGRLAQSGIIALGVLVAVTILVPSFRPRDLIQMLGIGSVAIGFAFKDVFQNFLAGILILLNQPFRVGDQIVAGDFEGTVEDIQTRATFLRTYDNRRVLIPNADLYTGKVIVNTAFDRIRLEYDLGIGYGDDLERARELILETVRGVPGVLPEPAPEALVLELGESSVNFRVFWYVPTPRRIETLRARDRVISALLRRLYVEEGIDFPYPTRQILFHDQTEAGDGDRTRQREGWPPEKS